MEKCNNSAKRQQHFIFIYCKILILLNLFHKDSLEYFFKISHSLKEKNKIRLLLVKQKKKLVAIRRNLMLNEEKLAKHLGNIPPAHLTF